MSGTAWRWVELDTVVDDRRGIAYGVLKPGERPVRGVPMLRVTDIRRNVVDEAEIMRISDGLHAEFKRTRLQGGEVLVSIQGTVGRIAIVPPSLAGANVSRTLAVVPLAAPHSAPWVYWALRSPQLQAQMESVSGGSTRDSLNLRDLRKVTIPLAPVLEQRRIVEAIEAHFTQLDAAVAALARVRGNLKRYRAAVLKNAFIGKLVAGSDTKDWTATTIGEALHIIDYRGRTPPYAETGIPHLRSQNVKQGTIVWEGLAFVSQQTYDEYMTRGIPKPGDVLFTTEAPLGQVAMCPGIKFSLAQRLMVLRPRSIELRGQFLLYLIMDDAFQRILGGRSTGTTVGGVSAKNFRPARLAYPGRIEQDLIVAEIARRLSVADALEAEVEASLKRCLRMRQAILKKAFEGRLVLQDPSDEPASVMVEGIRAAAPSGQAQGGRRKRMVSPAPTKA